MGVPTSEVGYTPAMPRREDHEVHKGHVVALGRKKKNIMSLSTAAVAGAIGLRKPTVIRNFKSVFHPHFNLLNLITVSFLAGANSLCDKAAIEVCFTAPSLLKSETTKAQTPL